MPFSIMYRLVVAFRNFLYDCVFLKIEHSLLPVISLGSLTMGGTGKTPATIALAEYFREKGRKVGIISRGYKRKSKGVVMVHDGKSMLQSIENAGDEPFEMAWRLGDIPVVVSEKRISGCKILEKMDCDIILADDAFQHRRLYRDVDIILLDASAPKCDYHIFPAGKLREPIKNICRADFVLRTRIKQASGFKVKIPENVDKFDIKELQSEKFVNPFSGNILKTSHFKTVTAFCGLGNPIPFFAQMNIFFDEGLRTIAFSDHAKYTTKQLQKIGDSDILITTEKDFWKLPLTIQAKENLFVNRITIKYPQEFLTKVLDRLKITSKVNSQQQ